MGSTTTGSADDAVELDGLGRPSERLYDRFEYDAVGREVRWNAVTTTEHDGLRVRVTDPLEHVTVTEQDPLGRIKAVTDAAGGVTRYSYGPFGGR
ncbi:hypothetical protein BE20_03190 [Sorangium cellulosum]|nr:hypothetical protein BE20_03190 [Sorangium cellulosum]